MQLKRFRQPKICNQSKTLTSLHQSQSVTSPRATASPKYVCSILWEAVRHFGEKIAASRCHVHEQKHRDSYGCLDVCLALLLSHQPGSIIFHLRAQIPEVRMVFLDYQGIVSDRSGPYPSIFFHDLDRLIERHQLTLILALHAARTCGNVRRWRLVVFILIDTKRCFSCPHPGVLNLGIWFLGEGKEWFCLRYLCGMFRFAQTRETCNLLRRELVGVGDSLRMYKSVVDLVAVRTRTCDTA